MYACSYRSCCLLSLGLLSACSSCMHALAATQASSPCDNSYHSVMVHVCVGTTVACANNKTSCTVLCKKAVSADIG